MIQLSEHFGFKKLLRFTLPSIVMMIFTSVYGVVDGFFVSNFAGKTAFTALNFIMPVIMILGSVGFLFGTGGSALIAKVMGERNKERANSIFTFLIIAASVTSIILAALGIIFLRPIAALLGAEGQMLEDCVIYARVILFALPAFTLQYMFQCFFSTAEKPMLGLIFTLMAGFANIILDAVLVAGFKMGLVGAAIATDIGQCVGGILPIVYFLCPNSSALKISKTRFDGRALIKSVTNGSSELMGSVAASVISMLYNIQLLSYAGEDGIAAYGVLMYVNFVFQAIFIGYSVGVAPIVSYHYGSKSYDEVRLLLKKNLILISIFSAAMFASAELLSGVVATVFVGYDKGLFEMTKHAFTIFSFSFLLSGFSIIGSSFFTALNSGLFSAIISFMRTLVFQIAAVFILPLVLQINGIWISTVVAEALAAILTFTLLILNRTRFHYAKRLNANNN